MANPGTTTLTLDLTVRPNLQRFLAVVFEAIADEIEPGYHLDPETDRPEGMSRQAWQRQLGSHQQKRVIAARYRQRAKMYSDAVAGEPGVEVKTGCDCSDPDVCSHCLAERRDNEHLVRMALSDLVQEKRK